MEAYKIAFRGLSEGRHEFKYVLDDAFFNQYPLTEETHGEVIADVVLTKSSLLMELEVHLDGEVDAICDRCLEKLQLPIHAESKIFVKQSNREEGNDDDFLVVAPDDDYIEVGELFYEIYMLNYPMRVVHDNDSCDENMQEMLDEYIIKDEEKPTDPRWDALKKLIN